MNKQQILFHSLKVQEGKRIPFSTGSPRVDFALYTGGILPGDLVEISGPPSSGKTTICQHIAASIGKSRLPVVWIDSDHTFEPGYALRCGVDPALLYIAQPQDAEQALDMLVTFSACDELGAVILDSFDSLVPRRELQSEAFELLGPANSEIETDDLISQALSAVWQRTQLSLVTIVYTHASQREMGASYHSLNSDHARMAPGLRASVVLRLDLQGPTQIKNTVVGIRVSVQCMRKPKSRAQGFPGASTLFGRGVSLNSPFQQPIDLDIMYKLGIVKAGEIFDLSLGLGLIEYQDGRFFHSEYDLGTSRSDSADAIERLGLSEELELMIHRKLLW